VGYRVFTIIKIMSDPRRPQNIKHYKAEVFGKAEEATNSSDFYQLLSLSIGMYAFVMKVKWACWVALFFFITSYFNMQLDKRFEKVMTGSGIIIVSFVSVYVQGPALAAQAAAQAAAGGDAELKMGMPDPVV
jgi:hypothetical protein